MAKRSTKAKRSLQALPKGLPSKKRSTINPFDTTVRHAKKPKHEVHNRFSISQLTPQPSKLAQSLSERQQQIRLHYQSQQKVNTFQDRRMGEQDPTMTRQEQAMARLVKERSRRSKRSTKYNLTDNDDNDNEDAILTHGGKNMAQVNTQDYVMLSDDEGGDLEAMDTELHFGGGTSAAKSKRNISSNPYGPSSTVPTDLTQLYSRRKTELDDLIARRKLIKAERLQSKEQQSEAFETMDESFKDLAQLLQFRDKKEERKERDQLKANGILPQEDKDMADWDKEMKEYLFDRKVKATDRTKTPEEIVKEEADRLHKLETRRLARMNGDFENDDFDDISGDEETKTTRKKKKRSKNATATAEKLDDSDDDDDEHEDDQTKVRFTSEGLVHVDKNGKVVGKVEQEKMPDSEHFDDESDNDEESMKDDQESEEDGQGSDEDDQESVTSDEESETEAGKLEENDPSILLQVGSRVNGNYRVKEQFGEQSKWYAGKILQVNKGKDGCLTYNIEYDDGDFEDDMKPENVRPLTKSAEEKNILGNQLDEEIALKRKRQKAKLKARQGIPFVFEVPTTLETLHEMIGKYASTGKEASLIIQRIHASNSVRLDKRNGEKMQNFYDVVLRRFVAVGDAIYTSGDGGGDLGRYEQLNALTKVLYSLSQDSPESASAVWGRRLGVIQNAHAKRLRDAEFVSLEDDETDELTTAWPSTGIILLLKTVGHLFPATDLKHQVVTPTVLLLGQMIAQTPVRSVHDLVMGLMCCGLMIEYTRGAKRVPPEAIAFLASVLRLFGPVGTKTPVPTIEAAWQISDLTSLRKRLSCIEVNERPMLSFDKDSIQSPLMTAGVLASTLHLVRVSAESLQVSLENGEPEAFAEVSSALLSMKAKSTKVPLPKIFAELTAHCASAVAKLMLEKREPLQRRLAPATEAIKSLAPRMEDPTKYTFSKDKGKSAKQAELDRNRREYKREHKAVSRELRLDAVFVEKERRREKDMKDKKAKDKRNKNFSWLEGEQAAMNQQVAQGGGLLSGGGMGAARAKAKSGRMGIKKGGKL